MIELVKNEPKYWEYIRFLRTCKENAEGFIEQVQITEQDQKNYMLKHEHNYYVCLFNSKPAGFVGVVNSDIRIATDPLYKKQGIGKFMLKKISELYPNATAKVKLGNINSINLFLSCDYKDFKIDNQFRYFKYKDSNEIS
jgi:hypothetical protein